MIYLITSVVYCFYARSSPPNIIGTRTSSSSYIYTSFSLSDYFFNLGMYSGTCSFKYALDGSPFGSRTTVQGDSDARTYRQYKITSGYLSYSVYLRCEFSSGTINSNTFTIGVVDCYSITSSTSVGYNAYIFASGSTTYIINDANSVTLGDTTNCEITGYTLSSSTTLRTGTDSEAFTSSTGYLTSTVSQTRYTSKTYTIYVGISTKSSVATQASFNRTISKTLYLLCGTSSGFTLSGSNNASSASFEYGSPNTEMIFQAYSFDFSQSQCGTVQHYLTNSTGTSQSFNYGTSSSYAQPDLVLSDASTSGYKSINIASSSTSKIGTHNFYIYITTSSGGSWWGIYNGASSYQFSYTLYCGATYTTVAISTAAPTDFLLIANTANSNFTAPIFKTEVNGASETTCPMTNTLVGSSISDLVIEYSQSNHNMQSGNIYSTNSGSVINLKYQFQIQVSAASQTSLFPSATTYYYYVVGCVDPHIAITDQMSNVTKSLHETSISDFIVLPTKNLTFCMINNVAVTRLLVNDTEISGYNYSDTSQQLYKNSSNLNNGTDVVVQQAYGPTVIGAYVEFQLRGDIVRTFGPYNLTMDCKEDTISSLTYSAYDDVNLTKSFYTYTLANASNPIFGQGNEFLLPTMSCAIPYCCQNLTYEATSYVASPNANLAVVQTKITNITDNSNGTITIEANTTTKGNYIFYIRGKYSFSGATWAYGLPNQTVNVLILPDCSADYNAPTLKSLDQLSIDSNDQQYWASHQGAALLNLTFEKVAFTSSNDLTDVKFQADMSQLFQLTEPDCVHISYLLEVWNFAYQNLTEDENTMKKFNFDNTTGILQILDITETGEYIFYVSPCTNMSCTSFVEDGKYQGQLVIYEPGQTYVNPIIPLFKSDPVSQIVINIYTVVEFSYSYILPELETLNSSLTENDLNVTISGLESWMSYQWETRTISFNVSSFENNTETSKFELKLKVIDTNEYFKAYKIGIIILGKTNERVDTNVTFNASSLWDTQNSQKKKVKQYKEHVEFEVTKITMTKFGLLRIKFSERFDPADILQKLRKYLVISFKVNSQQPESLGRRLQSYNYTWELNEVFGNVVEIKINFTHPVLVSSGDSPDEVKIYFTNNVELKSVTNQILITKDKTFKVPRQVQVTEAAQAAQQTAEVMESSMKYIFVIALSFNILLSSVEGSMHYFVLMMRNLQLILNLPILKVQFPGNTLMICSVLIPVVMFDILENDHDINIATVLPFDTINQEKLSEELASQILEIGYDGYNAFINLGTVGVVFVLYIFQLLILMTLYVIKCDCCKNLRESYKKYLIWTGLLTMLIEGNLDFLICGILNMEKIVFWKAGETISFGLAVLTLFLCCVVLPFLTICVICKDDIDEDEEFQQKWHVLIDGIKEDKPSARAFLFFFCLRRGLYVVAAFMSPMNNTISYQIIIVLLINLVQIIYQGIASPMQTRRDNRLELFNQLMVCFSCIHLICFTSFIPDVEVQYNLGWSFVIFIGIQVFVNLYFIIGTLLNVLRLYLIYLCLRSGKCCYDIAQSLKTEEQIKREIKQEEIKKRNVEIHDIFQSGLQDMMNQKIFEIKDSEELKFSPRVKSISNMHPDLNLKLDMIPEIDENDDEDTLQTFIQPSKQYKSLKRSITLMNDQIKQSKQNKQQLSWKTQLENLSKIQQFTEEAIKNNDRRISLNLN